MIQLDYLLIIGVLLSVLLFLLVGVFYYSKSKLLKGLNIWFLIILSGLLSYLLYPLYELTDYRAEFTSIVIIAAIIIKIIINLSIFMIADRITTKWISKLLLILWVVFVECLYTSIHLSYIVLLCVTGGIILMERFRGRRNPI
ncbi:phosphatase [Veillonella denticariosi JCM 15641]|uniref:Phosphatase n=1 Tax=Veillonella denticariosi JCM 15641 TaxID=1298594 RepID=A0A2S7ZA22_9FIRM|nr:phosphatase [Veillonella denticariosi JCM 15641]